jgi:two-component system, NtrC family, sensor histidine kinase HydH
MIGARAQLLVISAERLREMSERRQRRWSWWVGKGAVAMATIAALSLAVTVGLAQHALDNAADVVVRGDGDTLVAGVIVDLWEAEWPVTSETLTPVLAKHAAQRLLYVALVDRDDHHVLTEAGTAAIAKPFDLPGEVARQGRRVRLIDALARLSARTERRRDIAELTRPRAEPSAPALAPSAGASQRLPNPRPYLVVEFEPPVIERLQKDLMRISVVAALAALILVAFAFAWSRTMARLSEVQQQAERERRLVALGRASSVLAHELRNPLATLKGHAQLLVEDLTEPSRAKAARVVEGAERLERLTSVLLDFVRDGPLDVRAVTPAEVVDRALATLPKDRVRVNLSGAPEVLYVDPERTSLALRNLLQNAVQATADGAGAEPVEIRIEGDAHQVVIEVRDHGPGLAPGAQGQIFEPFVTTKTRGTGLGLAIARRIAEQHHGSLTGDTHSQGGAVFRLVLPLVSEPAGPP